MSSIQRVIQNKRRPQYEVEREEYERKMAASISKAINREECATKEKHVRQALVGTWKDGGANLFWTVAMKLPIQDNPVVSWKFCHVVHKLLTEGHHNVLFDSLKFVSIIAELGKLWSHLKEGYGLPIAGFCKLLLTKLSFHKKYPMVAGNLRIDDNLMAKITGNDLNTYFELSVDMIDYLDALLALQDYVFNSLDWSRSNSMTARGQCLLMPLIQVIQASASLYDWLVKILFRLHAQLPVDTLQGHRDRFQQLFNQLAIFYDKSRNLQLYKNLVQVPFLPSTSPNFLEASELAAHHTPVVTIKQQLEEQEEATSRSPEHENVPPPQTVTEGTLLDFSYPTSRETNLPIGQLVPMNEVIRSSNFFHDMGAFETKSNGEHPIVAAAASRLDDKDILINQLMQEIQILKERLEKCTFEHKERYEDMCRKVQCLENLVNELSQVKSQLEQQLEGSSQIRPETVAALEEKNRKWREVYSKLRDEHVTLLRKHAEVNKLLAAEKAAVGQVGQQNDVDQRLRKTETALAEAQQNADALEESMFQISEQNRQLEERLREAEVNRDAIGAKLGEKAGEVSRLIAQTALLEGYKRDLFDLKKQLISAACCNGVDTIRETMDLFHGSEMLGCTASPDFLISRTRTLLLEVDKLEDLCNTYLEDEFVIEDLVCCISQFSSRLCEALLQGKATSQSSSSAELTDELISHCSLAADEAVTFLTALKEVSWEPELVTGHCASLLNHLEAIQTYAGKLKPDLSSVEELGQLVDNEIEAAEASIEAAEAKFRELLECSRNDSSGVQLQVNEIILKSCSELMIAIKVLVRNSKILQKEIAELGRGSEPAREFYRKNHQWTEGLLSAAKAVGCGATALVESADNLVRHNGKLEHLMACSSQIAVYTSQLMLASKVGAREKSLNLAAVMKAGVRVSETKDAVVTAARSAVQQLEEADLKGLSGLSWIQTQRVAVEARQKVYELETELESARRRMEEVHKEQYKMTTSQSEDASKSSAS